MKTKEEIETILDTCRTGPATEAWLLSVGMRPYNEIGEVRGLTGEDFEGKQLWLIPKDWFGENLIGQELTNIFNSNFTFSDKSDGDHRGGMLAYGIALIPYSKSMVT